MLCYVSYALIVQVVDWTALFPPLCGNGSALALSSLPCIVNHPVSSPVTVETMYPFPDPSLVPCPLLGSLSLLSRSFQPGHWVIGSEAGDLVYSYSHWCILYINLLYPTLPCNPVRLKTSCTPLFSPLFINPCNPSSLGFGCWFPWGCCFPAGVL